MSQVDDSELLRPDFDLTTYINRLFPNEQSLAQLDVFIHKLDEEIVFIYLFSYQNRGVARRRAKGRGLIQKKFILG